MVDVSIIIPVYNREHLVREAINSAAGEGREVIVVDDASTDGTWSTIEEFDDLVTPIRLERNSGQAVARNVGLDAARGKYIKFLDSDDVLVAGHLEKEIAAAEEWGADIVVSGWGTLSVDFVERIHEAPRFTSIVDDVLAGRAVPTSSALYRRGKPARWDPSLRKLADWDFFAQSALSATSIVTIPGIAYWLRDHTGPRITRTTMDVNAHSHHQILHKFENRLRAEGKLTEARQKRLAQYFYKELRVLSRHDRDAFERALVHIHELDPHFSPREEERQWWMRIGARVVGTRNAILAYNALRRLLRSSRERISSATKRSHV